MFSSVKRAAAAVVAVGVVFAPVAQADTVLYVPGTTDLRYGPKPTPPGMVRVDYPATLSTTSLPAGVAALDAAIKSAPPGPVISDIFDALGGR